MIAVILAAMSSDSARQDRAQSCAPGDRIERPKRTPPLPIKDCWLLRCLAAADDAWPPLARLGLRRATFRVRRVIHRNGSSLLACQICISPYTVGFTIVGSDQRSA